MKILLIVPALTIGGIEVLGLRLAEAFGKDGHEVVLYDLSPEHRNLGLIAQYNSQYFKLKGAKFDKWKDDAFWIINGLLFKSGIHKSFRRWVAEKLFAQFVRHNKFDVACSLSFHEDYLACKYCPSHGTPVVVSMHGTYEYAAPQWPKMARMIYAKVAAIIYAADKNMIWYRKQPYFSSLKPTYKIYTGVDLSVNNRGSISRKDLGLNDSHFVYILVARGIKEKGWEQVIKAFLFVRAKYNNAILLLVGDSEYVQNLKRYYKNTDGIIFYGSHPNSLELTNIADVGVLPTYFAIETLPNVIIDYLTCGLPVISTDIGEIKEMLKTNEGDLAGIVLPLPQVLAGVCVEDLGNAMVTLLSDTKQYDRYASAAKKAVLKFDIQDCVQNYIQVFEQVIGK